MAIRNRWDQNLGGRLPSFELFPLFIHAYATKQNSLNQNRSWSKESWTQITISTPMCWKSLSCQHHLNYQSCYQGAFDEFPSCRIHNLLTIRHLALIVLAEYHVYSALTTFSPTSSSRLKPGFPHYSERTRRAARWQTICSRLSVSMPDSSPPRLLQWTVDTASFNSFKLPFVPNSF